MSKTLKQGFLIFLSRLTPNLTETNSLKSHRKSINDCLISSFRITNFFRTGSTGSGTSICNYSDTDYFVVIPNSKIEENSIALSTPEENSEVWGTSTCHPEWPSEEQLRQGVQKNLNNSEKFKIVYGLGPKVFGKYL